MRNPSSRVLQQRCDIYSATDAQDHGGGYVPSYPSSPTYRSIPCTAQPNGFIEANDQGVLYQQHEWRLMLGVCLPLKNRDKIVFTDESAVTHTVYVQATRDEAGRGMAWSIRAIERT